MASALAKACNAVAKHHRVALRVGLSDLRTALRLLPRAAAIACESRLALRTGRPTEVANITFTEHWP
ncbi:hypothetical protein RE428_06820 [Marinobacter nanhaiticus D15-8W]|nr:hypothetical protein RE428_06820 [Marinobacter nanhaiticus D15-8W]